MAYDLYTRKHSYHMKRLKTHLESLYPEIIQLSPEDFKSKMEDEFKIIRFGKADVSSWKSCSRCPLSFKSTNAFLYRNPPEGCSRKGGPWSDQETQHLIDVIHKGVENGADYMLPYGAKWGLLSLNIPGRVGYQCQNKYEQLVRKDQIEEIEVQMFKASHPVTKFEIHSQPALLPYQEETLALYLDRMIEHNQNASTTKISVQAVRLYYEPLHLARKAIINKLIDEGKEYINLDGSYIDPVQNPDEEILKAAEENPHELMREYQIRDFSASGAWILNFMDKHDYVFRKYHAEKRGVIKENDVDEYLAKLESAIRRFGPNRVINMDETHILLDYSSPYTIAKKGQKTVSIKKQYLDQKAGTTYIGTIAMDPTVRFPLYCIAKGFSERSFDKYQNTASKCKMDFSESGWCTFEAMKRYVEWLYEKMGRIPFALVLDGYTTHHKVESLFEPKGIEFIFVPANGTGKYQPLDRTIFGIVKKQLSEREAHNPIELAPNQPHTDKYAIIHARTLNIWQGLSQDAIKSAWEISKQ